ncbi:hypothetical protein BAUCODRAFT_48224, partial [Baudoinia panamericana UAMH 10762]
SVRRACDCCRKRKVRCDFGSPCTPCRKASIRCAYLQPPKKKGPKGLRSARVLHALRHIDDEASRNPTSPLSPEQHGAVIQPTKPANPPLRLPTESFLPYTRLFFRHMFPIMPIIDRNVYLDPHLYTSASAISPDVYCLLCALCAATIVQLDASIQQPPPLLPHANTDDLLADECLRERKNYDYVATSSTLPCITSFFLFAYFGNHESHVKAWYYLQEAITLAQNLNMDDDDMYARLEPEEAQWRRRLYWLLFVTERAYAVQRRKNTRLHASIQLPAVFESEDPHLLNGFVNLANLFSAVDDSFIAAWRGSRRQSLCDEAWLAKTQKQLDAAALALDNISETQHLDISVTREWLHVLAWQVGVSNGLIWGKGEAGMRLDYPIELARKVVQITSGANALALDSHGIGMEQKLSDIAACVADVLRCTADGTSATFLEGRQYLNIILQKLSSIRGKESRYLKPLMSKV